MLWIINDFPIHEFLTTFNLDHILYIIFLNYLVLRLNDKNKEERGWNIAIMSK